jgi:hypothetical protein
VLLLLLLLLLPDCHCGAAPGALLPDCHMAEHAGVAAVRDAVVQVQLLWQVRTKIK